jgi:hypothetical protein
MNYLSEINDMTDDELREICMLAVGLCAADEAMDKTMEPFWFEVLKEALSRGWGGSRDAVIHETMMEIECLRRGGIAGTA